MSRHEIVVADRTWVFGWDPPLQSFFLQVRDNTLSDDDNPVVWLGADRLTRMPDVDNLVHAAQEHDLAIEQDMQLILYVDQDENR